VCPRSPYPGSAAERLDRYLDALETWLGLKANRNEITRHALRLFLEAQAQGGLGTPPRPLQEDRPPS